MADAFYRPGADPTELQATGHTAGPWDRELQHAGPPSALVARAVERVPTTLGGEPLVTRLTVEILGAVPVGDVRVGAAVVRPGRSVELVEAELSAGGRVAMRARAWRMRRQALTLPERPAAVPATAPPRPERTDPLDFQPWQGGYLDAIEWRFVAGQFAQPGPATAWARQRVPLVAEEEPTGLQRLMVLADSGNGLSQELDLREWWFINTELTVHLIRPPVGEWICVAAVSTLSDAGVGLAETQLYDSTGRLGRGAQALLVGPRRP